MQIDELKALLRLLMFYSGMVTVFDVILLLILTGVI